MRVDERETKERERKVDSWLDGQRRKEGWRERRGVLEQ